MNAQMVGDLPAERRVRILAAGGTIAMTGASRRRARSAPPELHGDALIAAVPGLAQREALDARTVVNVPSTHLTLDDQLRICREARDAARRGIGVVVDPRDRHAGGDGDALRRAARRRGADRLHRRDPPASAPGADGPANPVDAVSSPPARRRPGWAYSSRFGGEIHHARFVRKTTRPRSSPSRRPRPGHSDG